MWPFVGALPDGVVSCKCCGVGALEMGNQVPVYCHAGKSITDAASQDKKFCCKITENGVFMDPTHMYYYQVQTQLFVMNVEYWDFCVCIS